MQLSLYHFKNHRERSFLLGDDIQMLVGENGAGKSTFCEALMIALNAENPHHTAWSEKSTFGEQDWAIRLTLDDPFAVVYDGVSLSPKWYYREKSTTRPKYTAPLPICALWIQSDHLRVISGEPGERRNFLDTMLASASAEYHRLLKQYKTANAQRNKILQDIQEGLLHRRELRSWNTLLAQSAVPLVRARRSLFAWITSQTPETSLHLPGETRITLVERHPLSEPTIEAFLALITEYEDRDVIVGRTTIGPQLDDIEFSIWIQGEWKPARYTLSRGENKTLLLSFVKKVGLYIHHLSGKKPFFLLDDVLSELDEKHITALLELFAGTQTLITTQPNHTGKSTDTLPRIVW